MFPLPGGLGSPRPRGRVRAGPRPDRRAADLILSDGLVELLADATTDPVRRSLSPAAAVPLAARRGAG
jgi:hypothetical protein